MSNPYAGLGPGHFWKTAVAQAGLADAGPVRARSAKRFRMDPTDRLATAGSCFAQKGSAAGRC